MCLECHYPDYIAPGETVCTDCAYPCLTCNMTDNTATCLKCALGFTLMANGSCMATTCNAINFCKVCTNGTCLQCLPGYFWSMNDSRCLPGVAGCVEALMTDPGVCQKCIEGTHLMSMTHTCIQCPENCLFCSSSTNCLQCKFTYFITGDPNMICAPQCVSPCGTCMPGMPNMCTSCRPGFVMMNGTCMDNNCSASSSCNYCPTGFGLMADQTCGACPTNCVMCNMYANCTECDLGFWLTSDMSCMPCDDANCYYCLSGAQCNLCKPGFTML